MAPTPGWSRSEVRSRWKHLCVHRLVVCHAEPLTDLSGAGAGGHHRRLEPRTPPLSGRKRAQRRRSGRDRDGLAPRPLLLALLLLSRAPHTRVSAKGGPAGMDTFRELPLFQLSLKLSPLYPFIRNLLGLGLSHDEVLCELRLNLASPCL